MQLYVSNYVGQSLSDYKIISEGIWISKVTTLSLKDYCNARKVYCLSKHNPNCTRCDCLLQAAQIILDNTICSLSFVFKSVYPETTYNSEAAKLTMSLGLMQVEEEQSGEESEDNSDEGGETGEVSAVTLMN